MVAIHFPSFDSFVKKVREGKQKKKELNFTFLSKSSSFIFFVNLSPSNQIKTLCLQNMRHLLAFYNFILFVDNIETTVKLGYNKHAWDWPNLFAVTIICYNRVG